MKTIIVTVKNSTQNHIVIDNSPRFIDQILYINGHRLSQPDSDPPILILKNELLIITMNWRGNGVKSMIGLTFDDISLSIGQDSNGNLGIAHGSRLSVSKYNVQDQAPWSITIELID
ncbi:hypothetical protein ACTZGB_09730 [Yersinia bercovieri]|uniref:hypothetical protein n=1 Tax=Yersinia bercovieri TaxID=634 RepID=UPI00061BD3D0|nr:hypothetical protein [Yersinia bercovieri]MCB5304133.1 hypothetical protein [Yersinia bercovieri]CNF69222.1 Uncharacterised protein [Yersinia bercovieri]